MPTRSASAKWEGGLKGGRGSFSGQTGLAGQYNFSSRFENGEGSNPEELLAAAEAACYQHGAERCAREEWNAADVDRDQGAVHDRKGGRRVLDHEDAA